MVKKAPPGGAGSRPRGVPPELMGLPESVFAFIYNSQVVPVAAGILQGWFEVLANPKIANAAMGLRWFR